MADNADPVDETVVGEVKVTLDQDDFDADPIQALQSYLDRLSAAFGKAGTSSSVAFDKIRDKLQQLRMDGKITEEQFQGLFAQKVDENQSLDKWQKLAFKWGARLSPTKGQSDFRKEWDATALSVARFRMTFRELERPFQQIYHFVGQLRQANLQFALLSQQANTTAANLVSSGGAFAALGGNIASFARFRNSFELEMEKRNIGMGNGGQFTQALARYGIQYDPNSFESTMRNIVAFMSDSSKTDRQKLMAGQMLGLDQGMIAAAKRGNAFYDDYTRSMRGLSSHQTEAAKRAEDLSLETHKLFTAFQNLKNAIFVDLAPIVKGIAQIVTPVVEWFSKLPQPLRYVIEGLVGFGLALRTWGAFKILSQTGKGMIGSFASMGLGILSRGGSEALISKISSEVSKQASKAASDAATKALGQVAGSAAANMGAAAVGSRIPIPPPTVSWNSAVKDVNLLGANAAGALGGTAGSVGRNAAARNVGNAVARNAVRGVGANAAGALGGTAAKAGGLAMLGPWGAALGILDVASNVTNTIMGGIQRHNTNVRLDNIYSLLMRRIPVDFSASFANLKVGAGGGVSKEVKIESFNIHVQAIGAEDCDRLADTIEARFKTNLTSLLDE